MTQKMIYLKCNVGQDAYEALAEAKKDGLVPQSATIGSRGNTPKPPRVIGEVTVRKNESFWIVN